MASWADTAVVWVYDAVKGTVVIGPFGFVYWRGKKLVVAIFDERKSHLVSAYHDFNNGQLREYLADKVPRSAVVRFVRTGLLPK